MPSSGTCAADWPVEIRLVPGRLRRLWQLAGLMAALAAILATGLPWPGLALALLSLWVLVRCCERCRPEIRCVTIDGDRVVLATADGATVALEKPLRCRLQPGVISLALPGCRRVHIFADQCGDADFRALRRLLSAGAGE